jgi:protein TonB
MCLQSHCKLLNMETSKILNADFLDIIFDGKNKDYGAYDLRKSYNRRLSKALAVMGSICMVFFLTTLFASSDHGKNTITVKDIDLENYKDVKEKEKIIELPKPLPKPQEIRVATIQYTNFDIIKDDLVNEPPPEQSELDGVKIAIITVDGDKFDDYVSPPVEKTTAGAELPKQHAVDYDKIFYKVEKMAEFPGGALAWKRYLERNLNTQVPSDDGAAAGRYTVKVEFIVDREGNISNVVAAEVPSACPSCGPEAIKVIRKGPKWEPAIQNGNKVIYQAVQLITFEIAE